MYVENGLGPQLVSKAPLLSNKIPWVEVALWRYSSPSRQPSCGLGGIQYLQAHTIFEPGT